jgi:ABC-type transporter Mla subunit MlaD
MTNANGVRPGSQVLLGGVAVGTVRSVDLGPRNSVIADLSLNPKLITVGSGVSASIIAANLLGEEYVSLKPGNPNAPLPSGTLLAPSRITLPTDLDQIINVFDTSTRQRLAILINETGIAVAGRRSDVSATLRQLPLSAEAATSLLTQLVQDNHTLAGVVANSNQFIARINQQKADLGHVIDAASGAATTAAAQAGNLRQTLIDAPIALRALRSFITNVGRTASGLTPAAGQIAASAGPLNTLLGQVRPFERAAVPALSEAASVSPLLTKLADKGTPIVRPALPTVNALAKISRVAYPLTYWLQVALPDVLAVMQGWSRSIQFRDGLGHVFHAEVDISPDVVVNLSKFGFPAGNSGRAGKAPRRARPTAAGSSVPALAQAHAPATTGSRAGNGLSGLLKTLTGALGGVSGKLGGVSGGLKGVSGKLGGLSGALGGVSGAPPAASGASSGENLTALLKYLIGK